MTSLHTKYRPESLDEVVGQDSTVSSLRSVLKRESSSAFLFCGPAGTGKTTLARIVASETGADASTIREIDAATNTGVDHMRDLIELLKYRPIGGASRALIVDECHMLSKSAWNALLKVLEEPPTGTYWMLCTTEPEKVPATIASRCARYNLAHVARNEMKGLLIRIAKAEGIRTKKGVMDLCVESAEGSPRMGITALAKVADCKSLDEAEELLESFDPLEEEGSAFDFAKALYSGARFSTTARIVGELREAKVTPEAARRTFLAYATTVMTKNGKPLEIALNCMTILKDPLGAQDYHMLLLAAAEVEAD